MSNIPRTFPTERERFAYFLRTGRILTDEPDDTQKSAPPETKFNPWHDPRNGRFTFAPGGARTGAPRAYGATTGRSIRISVPIAPAKPVDVVPTAHHPDGSITVKIPPATDAQSLDSKVSDRKVSGRVDTPLPESGIGFRTYGRTAENQYGTTGMIERIHRLGKEWSKHSDTPFQVGDISRRGGGAMPGHNTHQWGSDIDVRPFRNDGILAPTSWRSGHYDPEKTISFIRTIKKVYPKSTILFNDPKAISTGLSKPWPGHDNHIHVKFRDE